MHSRISTILAIGALMALAATLAGFAVAGASQGEWSSADLQTIASMRWSEIGTRPDDPSNAFEHSPEAAMLGKHLFDDRGLSRNGEVACASCHAQDLQFQDSRRTGQGVGTGRRRTMPVMGAAGSPFLFWDGRKDSLWSQALGPMEDGLEHGGNRVQLVKWVRARHLQEYQTVFGKMPELDLLPEPASPNGTAAERAAWSRLSDRQRDEVNRAFANMGKAIAAYERTLYYGPSRLDRYAEAVAAGRDSRAILSASEVRGLRLFLHEGQCATCHNGPQLTDHAFHNTGVPPSDPGTPDPGRAEGVTKLLQDEFNCLGDYSDARPEQCAELQFLSAKDATQLGAFRTPGLRNVSARAPYMHAGQFSTLDEVIDHYARSPVAAIGRSELASPGEVTQDRQVIRLTPSDVQDIKAFLGTLTGPVLSSDDRRGP